MTLFDKYQILHRFPKKGQKIKFVKPIKNHWFRCLVDRENTLLEVGKEYTVRDIELNSSSTYVWLEEFPDTNNEERGNMYFSLHSFEWELPKLTKDDLIGYKVTELDRLTYKGNLKLDLTDCKYRIYGEEGIDLTPIYDRTTGVITDVIDNTL